MPDPWQSIGGGKAVLREGAIVVQDANGRDVIQMGKLDDDTYGLDFFDTAGNRRMRIGDVGATDYDVAIYDPASSGDTVRLSSLAFGIRADSVHATFTVTSITTWERSLTTPEVTATVGDTGKVFVFGSTSAANGSPSTAWGGYIGVAVDDATPSSLNSGQVTNGSASSSIMPISGGLVLEGLTPGLHNFSMQYGSYSAADVDFTDSSLVVWPL